MIRVFFILVASTLLGGIAAGIIYFRERSEAPLFIETAENSGITSPLVLPRGASWGDFDNDGWIDLLLVGDQKDTRLYRNYGDGTFRNVTHESGIHTLFRANAGIFGDYNNDGCLDIYLVTSKMDQLYRGACDGVFTDVSVESGISAESANGSSAAWGDYNNDGYLDIYVSNMGRPPNANESGERSAHLFQPNLLWRNKGDGTFAESAKEAGVEGYTECAPDLLIPPPRKTIGGPWKMSFQSVWFDSNNDGLLDLFVANDGNVSPLYKNAGDGTFRDATDEAGLCRRGTGMGVAVGDYTGNGYADLYVTNVGSNLELGDLYGNYLWRNRGDGTFVESALEAGVMNKENLGWGAEFFDFDNDGLLDLYVANGAETGVPGVLALDTLYRNRGEAAFENVAAKEGIFGNHEKQSAAIADYTNNGFPDIIVAPSVKAEPNSPTQLYKNNGNRNNWLLVQLKGIESNPMAIGARVVATIKDVEYTRFVLAGSSFRGQSAPWPIFGLGSARHVQLLTIYWPSGRVTVIENVPANQRIVLQENQP